jgi:hypothetical protein
VTNDHDVARPQQREQAVRGATSSRIATFRRVDAHDADALAVQPERIAVDDSQWQRAVDGRRARRVIARDRRRCEGDHDDERETESATHDTLMLNRRRSACRCPMFETPQSTRRASPSSPNAVSRHR